MKKSVFISIRPQTNELFQKSQNLASIARKLFQEL